MDDVPSAGRRSPGGGTRRDRIGVKDYNRSRVFFSRRHVLGFKDSRVQGFECRTQGARSREQGA
jgi:hypothetical protein